MSDHDPKQPTLQQFNGGHPSVEQLSALLDGELPAAESDYVAQHRDQCSVCTEMSRQLIGAQEFAAEPARRNAAAPLGAGEAAVSAALAATRPSSEEHVEVQPTRARQHRAFLGAAAAVAALALAGGAIFGMTRLSASSSPSSASPSTADRRVNDLMPGGRDAAAGVPRPPAQTVGRALSLWRIDWQASCLASDPGANRLLVHGYGSASATECIVVGPMIGAVDGTVVTAHGTTAEVRLRSGAVERASYRAALQSGQPVAVVAGRATEIGTGVLRPGFVVSITLASSSLLRLLP